MMGVQNKEKFKRILLTAGMVVCLFLTGCAGIYLSRGFGYADKGAYDHAIAEFDQAIEINPKYAEAYFGRGIVYLVKGAYDDAIVDLNKALEIDPKFARAYYKRGVAYAHKKQYDKAWEDVHAAQRLGYQVDPGFLKDLREASGREE